MRGAPVAEVGTACAVTCQTCAVQVWQGDIPPDDGQVLLSAYADSAPGTVCPSKVEGCPNKTAAVAERPKHKPVVAGDLDDLRKRLDKLEAKVKP